MAAQTRLDLTKSLYFISGSSHFVSGEKLRIQASARKLSNTLQNALNDEAELAEVLSMIKVCSQSQTAILPYFQEEISSLISHDSKMVRNHAYELLLKLLRFDPTLSQQLIVPFIGCLESNDAQIARHAIEKLPDVAPLAQEQLESLLNTAFNLGLSSNLEVVVPICDTLNLMNGLAGY